MNAPTYTFIFMGILYSFIVHSLIIFIQVTKHTHTFPLGLAASIHHYYSAASMAHGRSSHHIFNIAYLKCLKNVSLSSSLFFVVHFILFTISLSACLFQSFKLSCALCACLVYSIEKFPFHSSPFDKYDDHHDNWYWFLVEGGGYRWADQNKRNMQ